MNYLFLDVDGVLNTHYWFERRKKEGMPNPGSQGFQHREHRIKDLIPEMLARLDEIVDKTSCKIVVCSSWRTAYPLPDFKWIFKNAGFKNVEAIVGATPVYKDRPDEVKFYVDTKLSLEDTWVVLDDFPYPAEFAERHVQTCFWADPDNSGLTEHFKNEVLRKFNVCPSCGTSDAMMNGYCHHTHRI